MRTTFLLAVALLASGCLSAVADDGPLPDPTGRQAPEGPGAGSPATHGAPQRTDGPVRVELTPTGYVARQEVTVRNDFGGASASRVRLATSNGAVSAAAWEEGGYLLAAHLEGRGKTEQEARTALATLTVLNQDGLEAGVLALGLQVRFGDPPAPVQGPAAGLVRADVGDGALQRSARVVASLPAAPAHDLAAETTNGAVQVEGLHGPHLALETTNGGIAVQGSWDEAVLETTNGNVQLDGLVNDLEASTTNGGIRGTVESGRNCRQILDTTNGNVSLRVRDRGHGYSLEGSTTNGRVTLDVAGARAEGSGTQRAQTPGFATAPVQVRMEASATNGNVALTSA